MNETRSVSGKARLAFNTLASDTFLNPEEVFIDKQLTHILTFVLSYVVVVGDVDACGYAARSVPKNLDS